MQRQNLDLGVPLTREQWEQVGSAADFIPDDGVLFWTPGEFEVIRVITKDSDAPESWRRYAEAATPPGVPEREVARLVYNDGRPYAQLHPPSAPAFPAVRAADEHEMQVDLERWVRAKWHLLLEQAGIRHNPGALPADEPNPPHR